MNKIYIDPSELSSSSLLPPLPNFEPLPGLEELTGCDFVVTSFPLPLAENTLQAHIKSGAIFVQRKSGYDFIGNFEQIWYEVARIQACKIPMSQVFILAIGQYKQDDNGSLRITGKRPLANNEKITYKTFNKIKAQLIFSGVTVFDLNDESEIEGWIEAIIETRQDIKDRNSKKEMFIKNEYTLFEEDGEPDLLQEVIVIPSDDIRSVSSCGFPDLGPARVRAIFNYAQEQGVDRWGIHFWKIMTDEDENGKAVHNVKGIGDKLRKQWRLIIGLPDGYNLSVQEIEFNADKAYNRGWRQGLITFRDLLERGQSAKEAFQNAMEFKFEFFE